MFQNKHIIRFSFIGLFLAILASILFYRYFTLKNIVLETVLKENKKIVSRYVNDIWNKHIPQAKLLKTSELKEAIKNKEFNDFTLETLNYFNNQTYEKISILNATGEEFFTTNPEIIKNSKGSYTDILMSYIDMLIIPRLTDDQSVKLVLKGEKVNNFIPNALLGEDTENRYFIESYYPILDESYDEFYVDGIVKCVSDITEEWNKIKYFETRVSLFLLSVFILFFAIILFNTHHAQRIIDQQVANNKFLEEAKIKAESESTAKTQFLANISHELRTPLNAIIGFSEVILTEAYGKLQPDQYKEYINDINNSGKHLLSVINDILDFSKASSDKLTVDMIEVDTSKLVNSSIRFVKPRADEAKVELVQKMPKDHVVIKADPKRLKQALLNLLSNAVKFTPENGSVTIELEKNIHEQKVYIRVIDTGIGMEEKDIPKALSSFGQVDNKLSRRYEGTGLGLPLTKKLVELMNGQFELSSSPGKGTKVTITFNNENL